MIYARGPPISDVYAVFDLLILKRSFSPKMLSASSLTTIILR